LRRLEFEASLVASWTVMTLSYGTRLGPYEIQDFLGAGGMGEVYCARDTRLDRTVAIKVLRPALSMSPEERLRFAREARTASRLSHPNICTLHDVGQQDGTDFLVMEYLEGETLSERLRKGALPLDLALRCGIEIADALDRAHRQGIVHRDLKPGNVMLTKAGAKLLDFGLAKFLPTSPEESSPSAVPTVTGPLTTPGAILGTVPYLAPEQIEGKAVDARTDLFAFGTLLYEMVTGARPFEGTSGAAIMAGILHSDPPPITQQPSAKTIALDRLIRACLAKDPEARWQSAHDLVIELRWIAEGAVPSTAMLGAGLPRVRERFAWAAAVLGLSLVVLILWLIGSRPSSEGRRPLVLSVMPPEAGSSITQAELSPDGRWLAFTTTTSEGKNLLWVRPLESSRAEPLPGTEDAQSPFWSPDGRALGFFANGKLQKVDVPGGRPEIVCDAPFGFGGSWNRKGVILFGNLSGRGILRVSASGGEATPVTWPTGNRADLHPFLLPDGRHFLFVRGSRQDSLLGIYVGSLGSKEIRRLLPDFSRVVYVPPGYLLFVRSGDLVAQRFDANRLQLEGEPAPVAESIAQTDFGGFIFSTSNSGVLAYRATDPDSRLVWFDRAGHALGTVGEPSDYAHVDLSPDDGRVAVERIEHPSGTHDVWILDVQRGTSSRLTFSGDNTYPIWSPDGTRIAFTSYRSGYNDLYERLASGAGNEHLLLGSKLQKWPTSWSRDGRSLIFEGGFTDGPPDTWVLSLTGDAEAAPFERTPAWENGAQLSPDGRWLAYASNTSGRPAVFVQSFPTPGSKWQVSSSAAGEPRWRSDGKELFYGTLGGQIMAVDVTADGAFHAGAPHLLFQPRGAKLYKNRFAYAVSRDGQRFLVNVEGASISSVTIALDWPDRLRKH
jgi:serine/threonine protein kinase